MRSEFWTVLDSGVSDNLGLDRPFFVRSSFISNRVQVNISFDWEKNYEVVNFLIDRRKMNCIRFYFK